MAANFQRWTPAKAEADLLVDMMTARLAPAKIAKALYIDVRTLRAYLARLSAAAEAPYPEAPTLPPRGRSRRARLADG